MVAGAAQRACNTATTPAQLPHNSQRRTIARRIRGVARRSRGTTTADRRLVSEAGLEPARPRGHQPLKLARLPIPPLRRDGADLAHQFSRSLRLVGGRRAQQIRHLGDETRDRDAVGRTPATCGDHPRYDGRREQRQARHECPKPVVHRVPVTGRIDWVQDRLSPSVARGRRLRHRRPRSSRGPRASGTVRRLPARRGVGVRTRHRFATSPDAQIPLRRSARRLPRHSTRAALDGHAGGAELVLQHRGRSDVGGLARRHEASVQTGPCGQATARRTRPSSSERRGVRELPVPPADPVCTLPRPCCAAGTGRLRAAAVARPTGTPAVPGYEDCPGPTRCEPGGADLRAHRPCQLVHDGLPVHEVGNARLGRRAATHRCREPRSRGSRSCWTAPSSRRTGPCRSASRSRAATPRGRRRREAGRLERASRWGRRRPRRGCRSAGRPVHVGFATRSIRLVDAASIS